MNLFDSYKNKSFSVPKNKIFDIKDNFSQINSDRRSFTFNNLKEQKNDMNNYKPRRNIISNRNGLIFKIYVNFR